MTKTQLVKFLGEKRTEALQLLKDKYDALSAAQQLEFENKVGMKDAAKSIQEYLEAALDVYNAWRRRHYGFEMELAYSAYESIRSELSRHTQSDDGVYRWLKEAYKDITQDRKRIDAAYRTDKASTGAAYDTLVANVRSMKDAQAAAEYLTGMGFDLSALMAAPAPCTAIMAPVDTRFLFI